MNSSGLQKHRPVPTHQTSSQWFGYNTEAMKHCILALATFSLFLSLDPLMSQDRESGFMKKNIELNGEAYSYQVFVPNGWSAREQWPVILFLHGLGERGSDGDRQTQVGLGPALRRSRQNVSAVVVMPQCRRGVWWNDPQMEKLVEATLEGSIKEYNGDRDRVYLTGLSMGGYGTFYFGAKYPNTFAALVPVCGGIIPPRQLRQGQGGDDLEPYLKVAEAIKGTPVWAFHGSADPRVPVSESRKIVRALEEIGSPVKYTEYEGVDHNAWDPAYAEPYLLPWLLTQRLHNRN